MKERDNLVFVLDALARAGSAAIADHIGHAAHAAIREAEAAARADERGKCAEIARGHCPQPGIYSETCERVAAAIEARVAPDAGKD